MTFLTEAEPQRGTAIDVLPGITRIVARNPSVMTYFGTNTYLIEGDDGLTILDPGPDDEQHVEDILRAAVGRPITRLVLTHTHSDHLGATARLKAATNATSYGYRVPLKPEFVADVKLDDGDEVAGLRALHTPGHAADHLSFGYHVAGVGEVLFSGDHVMPWSSSIVSPPDGDMVDYYNSLNLLLNRHENFYLAGHGPLLPRPRELVRQLLEHRQKREASILKAMHAKPPHGAVWSVAALAEHLYAKTDLRLKVAAQRNVLAHLMKLAHEGKVQQLEDQTPPPPSPVLGDDLPPTDAHGVKPAIVAMFMRDAGRRFVFAA